MITYKDIQSNKEINTYIEKSNYVLGVMGYTEHGFAHAGVVAQKAADILEALGHSERTIELAKIAGYMHDIGNSVNRKAHAQSGALMAFQILRDLGMDKSEVGDIVGAIGHHDEEFAVPINPIGAAIILADKADVRRSRVRRKSLELYDIHDRVNYAVFSSGLELDRDTRMLKLNLKIDTKLSSVMDYFETFLSRMVLCKKSADFLDLQFSLEINNARVL